MRHLITLADLSCGEIERIFSISEDLKAKFVDGLREPLLPGRVLAMLFEKQSLRTRVSFEAGMAHLGGTSLFLGEEVGFDQAGVDQALGHRGDGPLGVGCLDAGHDLSGVEDQILPADGDHEATPGFSCRIFATTVSVIARKQPALRGTGQHIFTYMCTMRRSSSVLWGRGRDP